MVKVSEFEPLFQAWQESSPADKAEPLLKNMSCVSSSRNGNDAPFMNTCFYLQSGISLNSFYGEIKRKGSPFIRLAFYRNTPGVFLDDAKGN